MSWLGMPGLLREERLLTGGLVLLGLLVGAALGVLGVDLGVDRSCVLLIVGLAGVMVGQVVLSCVVAAARKEARRAIEERIVGRRILGLRGERVER